MGSVWWPLDIELWMSLGNKISCWVVDLPSKKPNWLREMETVLWLIILLKMICSRTLETLQNNKIGRQLKISDLSPNLNIGTIQWIFHSVGITLVDKLSLKSWQQLMIQHSI